MPSDADYGGAVGRPYWTYFLFPTTVVILAILGIASGEAALSSVFPTAIVLLAAWCAWSMASGLYPWSMRP